MNEDTVINEAYQIALRDLKSDFGNFGIYAGPHNHHEYWARDSFFASLGALSIDQDEIVKNNLDLFIKYQAPSGEIPLRVEEGVHAFHILGIPTKYKKPKARFTSSQPWAGHAIDPTALFLIAADLYIKKTHDKVWQLRNSNAFKKASDWLISKIDERGLVREDLIGNWSDAIFKDGNVLYSNVVAWKAIDSLNYNKLISQKLKQSIIANFYDDKLGYFIDWIGKTGIMFRDFAPDGNLLAMIYGFLDDNKSKRILEYIKKENIDSYSLTAAYKLVWWQKLLTNIVFGPYNLKNKFTWWECYLALAKMKVGNFKDAKKDLYDLGKLIVKYKTVYEILDENGDPVKFFVYRSEPAIAWTSGMYIYAVNILKKSGILHS